MVKVGYSPPEQLRFGQCYYSSDLYALAVSTLVLLTGKLPSRLIDSSMKWQWRSYVKISKALTRILEKMLAELPSDRYLSATEVIAELNNTSQASLGDAVQSNSESKFSFSKFSFNLFSKQGKQQTTNEQPKQETSTISQWQTRASDVLSVEFLDYCQQRLASFVGPFATVMIKQAIDKNPGIVPEKLVEKLAAQVPDAQRSQDFQESMKISIDTYLRNQRTTSIQQSFISSPAISNPEFLERCRRELNSFIGPFGSVIIKDTLDQNPNLTPKELIDTLVGEIPNAQRAQQFRERVDQPNFWNF
ncbi:MAG: hypothetical protein HC908_02295 [Calothrix sp. SM1_7_51]|nr:hypothetical protein [Calothrix sp. SM1_7_51]